MNISCRTSSLIDISCWSILSSREAVPVPLSVRNTFRVLWKWIAAVRQKFSIAVTVFQRNSTNLMPLNSAFPFGIRTTVFQDHSSARWPSSKYSWVRPKISSNSEGSRNSSQVASHIQAQRCSALMTDGPSALFRRRWWNAPETLSSSGTDSSTGNGSRYRRASETFQVRWLIYGRRVDGRYSNLG